MKVRSVRRFCSLMIALALSISVWQFGLTVHAQKSDKARNADATAASGSDSKLPASANNLEYGAKVKANTTEPYFMTELVDHLPASDKIPSPDKILGYTVGEPGHLTYSKDLYRYYNELAKASPRVRVFTAPHKTPELEPRELRIHGSERGRPEEPRRDVRELLDRIARRRSGAEHAE